jgi:hypothetical protein
MRWVGKVARVGEMSNSYILVGKPEGKRPLGRSGHRWKDNIKMAHRKGYNDSGLGQSRDILNTVMNGGEILDYLSNW